MKPKTPEEIIALAKARKKLVEDMEKIKVAVNSASENENVRIILQHLMKLSGFRDNPVVVNGNREVTNSTVYNVGRESLFHDFRKLMSAETENLIERREE